MLFQWYRFEFVVVCTGRYGDVPKIPVYPEKKGPQVFDGQVLHSMDYCKLDQEAASQLLKNKKVIIVGSKKSAIDLALECAEANQGTIILYIYIYGGLFAKKKSLLFQMFSLLILGIFAV